MNQKSQQEQQFKIPQTIQQHKRQALLTKIISTLTGIQTENFSLKAIVMWSIVVVTFIVLKFVPNVQYGVCVGVNIGVCFAVGMVHRILEGFDSSVIHKGIASALFGYLWSHQLYHTTQTELIVLTLISILTSLGSVIMTPVRQFTSPTLYIKQLSVHSTLYIRLLLPVPLFIIQLILDYGEFFPSWTNHLYYIRLSISLMFLTWTFGWISTVYNSYFFLVNNVNRFLFGDEAKGSFIAAFGCLILNCIPIAIYFGWAQNDWLPVWILWIGSSFTSIVAFLFSYFFNQKLKNQSIGLRGFGMIIAEIFICGGLVALMLLVDFTQLGLSIKIITIIDLSVYVFFTFINFLSVPRNCFGFAIGLNVLNNQYLRAIQRVVLRLSAGFTVIILVENLNTQQLWTKLYQTLDIHVDIKFVQYFFVLFLAYRSYKRSLSQSTSFSFHFSILICLGLVYMDQQLESILAVLFFPPFPHNLFMLLVAPFTTPKKLSHKNQLVYQFIYICITIASILVFILSIGMLEFTMFFGLPFFTCVLPTINEGNKVKSKEHSLYEKIVEYIPHQLFRFRKQGFYLLRISKYIILAEIKQKWYGFGQVVDIKGLEVQEVTSCHSKEGQTIDKLVEQTWGDGTEFWNTSHLWTVLSPLQKQIIHVPTQNEIQLTGIIESKQFVEIFKDGVLKALSYEVSKLKYSEKQLLEGQQIVGDFSPICKKEKFQSLFPFKFAEQISLEFQYPQLTESNIGNKRKLPPIKNKKQVVNDFLDLLDSSPGFSRLKAETSTQNLNSGIKDEAKQDLDDKGNQNSQKLIQSTPKINIKQLNACLIMTLYHYSVGKFDYFNVKKVYDLINMQKGELSQVNFDQGERLLSRALCKAFKITVDKITMGQTEIELADFQEFEKTSFLGIAGSQDFNNAVAKDLQDIWTLNYGKGKLSVKRLSKAENELYMFEADACIIKSIWNNLRFELMYATNDNDERYSIQTHPYLMRNLWTEACEQPFGYPSYHSGNVLSA